jgi:hypothetical protein
MSGAVELTIFAIPKRFEGHFGMIQRNAARSWSRLTPRPQIILLGADAGTAEMAAEIGALHLPDVAVSPAGAPRLDDVFAKGQQAAAGATVCFVNADIVLTQTWMNAVQTVARWRPQFLLVGRRWNLDVLQPIDFEAPGWEADLVATATTRGRQATNMYVDYFAFPRGMIADVPPFAIGRPGYDNWLLWRTRQRGIPLVDVSEAAPVVHQNHDFSHINKGPDALAGTDAYWKGQDTKRNAELAGDWSRSFTTDHATHVVTAGAVRPAFQKRYLDARVETLRRRFINLTRPLRHGLGIDAAFVERLRNRVMPRKDDRRP